MTPALILHASGGALGILAGAAALAVRKGARLHRAFGIAFCLGMLPMAPIGAYMAIFEPQRGSVVVGIFTFYLVATAWATVRRKAGQVGVFEYGAPFIALGVAALLLMFGVQAARSPTGLLEGAPAAPHFLFACVAGFAAVLDLKLILRGGISGTQRIARHLWRMCAALFFAATVFFLGRQEVLPAFLQGSPILFVPAFAPLALMIFWLVRIRIGDRFKTEACGIRPRVA
jgi:hypothetical protein